MNGFLNAVSAMSGGEAPSIPVRDNEVRGGRAQVNMDFASGGVRPRGPVSLKCKCDREAICPTCGNLVPPQEAKSSGRIMHMCCRTFGQEGGLLRECAPSVPCECPVPYTCPHQCPMSQGQVMPPRIGTTQGKPSFGRKFHMCEFGCDKSFVWCGQNRGGGRGRGGGGGGSRMNHGAPQNYGGGTYARGGGRGNSFGRGGYNAGGGNQGGYNSGGNAGYNQGNTGYGQGNAGHNQGQGYGGHNQGQGRGRGAPPSRQPRQFDDETADVPRGGPSYDTPRGGPAYDAPHGQQNDDWSEGSTHSQSRAPRGRSSGPAQTGRGRPTAGSFADDDFPLPGSSRGSEPRTRPASPMLDPDPETFRDADPLPSSARSTSRASEDTPTHPNDRTNPIAETPSLRSNGRSPPNETEPPAPRRTRKPVRRDHSASPTRKKAPVDRERESPRSPEVDSSLLPPKRNPPRAPKPVRHQTMASSPTREVALDFDQDFRNMTEGDAPSGSSDGTDTTEASGTYVE